MGEKDRGLFSRLRRSHNEVDREKQAADSLQPFEGDFENVDEAQPEPQASNLFSEIDARMQEIVSDDERAFIQAYAPTNSEVGNVLISRTEKVNELIDQAYAKLEVSGVTGQGVELEAIVLALIWVWASAVLMRLTETNSDLTQNVIDSEVKNWIDKGRKAYVILKEFVATGQIIGKTESDVRAITVDYRGALEEEILHEIPEMEQFAFDD